jgi:competence protein ComEA
MMRKSKSGDPFFGALLLLLFLLGLHGLKGTLGLSGAGGSPHGEKVFVEISGDVPRPGVYGFDNPPRLEQLMIGAGLDPGVYYPRQGYILPYDGHLPLNGVLLSGKKAHVVRDDRGLHVFRGEMFPFLKTTLGIPVSVNREGLEGLTAVPGIGPKIAGAILLERSKKGRFRTLDELLFIQGIGPTLYEKIKRYLTL